MTKVIDLRSDTVTQPSDEMRRAMSEADVGDDVFGDDPTVNRLEKLTAELLGFEAGLFTSSGTQANFVGILSHCGRGDEYIVGQQAHTYKYEAGGAAVLGSIQPQPIEFEEDSTLDLEKVAEKIKPDDIHFARTKLLCLENTQNGKALPLDYLNDAHNFAKTNNLAIHLDGARLMNAVVKCRVEPPEITKNFDSVSLCLSKGLGAPVGSVLCGSKSFISEARKWRKMAGGGMRQAGIIAAAGIYALEHNVSRLQDDHLAAEELALGLRAFPALKVHYEKAQTNMVFFDTDPGLATKLASELQKNNILMVPGKRSRLVTHMDVTIDDIRFVLKSIKAFLEKLPSN